MQNNFWFIAAILTLTETAVTRRMTKTPYKTPNRASKWPKTRWTMYQHVIHDSERPAQVWARNEVEFDVSVFWRCYTPESLRFSIPLTKILPTQSIWQFFNVDHLVTPLTPRTHVDTWSHTFLASFMPDWGFYKGLYSSDESHHLTCRSENSCKATFVLLLLYSFFFRLPVNEGFVPESTRTKSWFTGKRK